MKRLRSHRTGLPLTRTQCGRCTATISGRLWPADRVWLCDSCRKDEEREAVAKERELARRAQYTPPQGTDSRGEE